MQVVQFGLMYVIMMFYVDVVDQFGEGLEGMFYINIVRDFMYGEGRVYVMVMFVDDNIFECLQMFMVIFGYVNLYDYSVIWCKCRDFFGYLFCFKLIDDVVFVVYCNVFDI